MSNKKLCAKRLVIFLLLAFGLAWIPWIIMNKAKNRIMILNNTALFASLKLDSDAKGVAAIDFNGTIESDGANPDVIFLKKTA